MASEKVKLEPPQEAHALADHFAKGRHIVRRVSCFSGCGLSFRRVARRGSFRGTPSTKIRPAGRKCELFNDQFFGQVRKAGGIPYTFVNDSWSFDDLKGSGGKGGYGCCKIGNDYFVKELSNRDHLALRTLAPSYAQHMLNPKNGGSMINEIYLHFRDSFSGRNFYVMRNHCVDPPCDHGDPPRKALYDIKGCADDRTLELRGCKVVPVRKRIWHLHMWGGQCCWTPLRHAYKRGKEDARRLRVAVGEAERREALRIVQRDTDFLARHGLMDYSLLLACHRPDAPADAGAHTCSGVTCDGEPVRLSLSIIDILQTWTLPKMVARCIKTLERDKATIPPVPYADRFERHFEELLALPGEDHHNNNRERIYSA